jgi:hypothetical protein
MIQTKSAQPANRPAGWIHLACKVLMLVGEGLSTGCIAQARQLMRYLQCVSVPEDGLQPLSKLWLVAAFLEPKSCQAFLEVSELEARDVDLPVELNSVSVNSLSCQSRAVEGCAAWQLPSCPVAMHSALPHRMLNR